MSQKKKPEDVTHQGHGPQLEPHVELPESRTDHADRPAAEAHPHVEGEPIPTVEGEPGKPGAMVTNLGDLGGPPKTDPAAPAPKRPGLAPKPPAKGQYPDNQGFARIVGPIAGEPGSYSWMPVEKVGDEFKDVKGVKPPMPAVHTKGSSDVPAGTIVWATMTDEGDKEKVTFDWTPGAAAARPRTTRNINNAVDPPPTRRWSCQLAQQSPATVIVDAPTREEAKAAYLRAVGMLHSTETPILCTPVDEDDKPIPDEPPAE